jgi:drug/metabolite transporter (DMT)-like permease
MAPRRTALAVPLLVAVTAVWGSTFVVVKDAVARMPVMGFLVWRFAIATAVMVVLRPRALAGLGAAGWRRGGLLGLALAGGYVAQTYGLRTISAAASGFVTGMFVVFTPLISAVALRRRVPGAAWAGVGLATAGLALISLNGSGRGGGLGIGTGELLTVVCAFAYAVQLVGLGEWSARHDPYALAVVQLATVTVVALVAALPGQLEVPPDGGVWAAVLVTSVLATAVAFLVQTWAQSFMSATRAAVVLTMEPVFAGLAAVAAGERLDWRVPAGGALVLAAMYLVELGPRAGRDAEVGRLEA